MKFLKLIVITAILPLMGCQHSTSEIDPAQHALERTTVTIGDQSWDVEVAETTAQRQQGLMFREELKAGTGMLFVFKEEDFHSFWMRNTLIPLELIWIGADLKVVDAHTLQPCTTDKCPTTEPSQKALYVLEVNAGEFKGAVGEFIFFKQ